jgi:nitrogen fixation protein NifB
MCPNGSNASAAVNGIPGQTDRHPCYSQEAHHQYARMHLPVAPRCNIGCNYCNRKYDCVNESRPGVTSEVLQPVAARNKFLLVKERLPNLSVVGIAGPGDALANWKETRRALELIREEDKDIVFCLSTNGLMLPHYAPEIVRLGVNHVTVTMNCLDPDVGAQIYKFVYYEGKRYEGKEAAEILGRNQLEGIRYLTSQGVMVKVNTVMIQGVNEAEIPKVAKRAKELGAFIVNIMPLIPAKGSAFEHFPQTSTPQLNAMRNLCQLDIRQMRHCQQCRADAIGLLNQDISHEFRPEASQPAKPAASPAKRRYRIAVTSKYGKLVDQHFGHAWEFAVYEIDGNRLRLLEKRSVQQYCAGSAECDEDMRKEAVVEAIKDCDAVLTMRIGLHAQKRLLKKNIMSVEYCYTVESGLFYAAQQLALREAI